MTLANRITMARIVIAPMFFALFQLAAQQVFPIPAYLQMVLLVLLLLLFAASELSDLLDGMIARRMSQVSGVGKLMDPFSDIFSRVTYFFCFYQVGLMPTYAFILILWREVSMLFVRQLVQLSGEGPLPARWAGKVKAVVYFGTTSLGLVLFVLDHWPGSGLKDLGEQLCAFTGAVDHQNWLLLLYAFPRVWILPVCFIMSVLASWYSFLLYLRDFLPTLRKML